MTDQHTAPEQVEQALQTILDELGDHGLDASQRCSVEIDCQQIHATFGGESPDPIYPEGDRQMSEDRAGGDV